MNTINTEDTQPTPADVRALRSHLGLTQTEFGKLSHCSLRTVQDWEHGKREMPLGIWELYLLKSGQRKLTVCQPKH